VYNENLYLLDAGTAYKIEKDKSLKKWPMAWKQERAGSGMQATMILLFRAGEARYGR
jgi:hypothetical protein